MDILSLNSSKFSYDQHWSCHRRGALYLPVTALFAVRLMALPLAAAITNQAPHRLLSSNLRVSVLKTSVARASSRQGARCTFLLLCAFARVGGVLFLHLPGTGMAISASQWPTPVSLTVVDRMEITIHPHPFYQTQNWDCHILITKQASGISHHPPPPPQKKGEGWGVRTGPIPS